MESVTGVFPIGENDAEEGSLAGDSALGMPKDPNHDPNASSQEKELAAVPVPSKPNEPGMGKAQSECCR